MAFAIRDFLLWSVDSRIHPGRFVPQAQYARAGRYGGARLNDGPTVFDPAQPFETPLSRMPSGIFFLFDTPFVTAFGGATSLKEGGSRPYAFL